MSSDRIENQRKRSMLHQVAWLRDERPHWHVTAESIDESIFTHEVVIQGFWPELPVMYRRESRIASEEEYNAFMFQRAIRDSGLDPKKIVSSQLENASTVAKQRLELRSRLLEEQTALARSAEAKLAQARQQLTDAKSKPYTPVDALQRLETSFRTATANARQIHSRLVRLQREVEQLNHAVESLQVPPAQAPETQVGAQA